MARPSKFSPRLEVLESRAVPATFIVDTTADTTANDGVTTFREALQAAKATPEADLIRFNIPGGGLRTITLGNTLDVEATVTIDGYTQPGSSPNTLAVGNNATLNVELAYSASNAAIRVRADAVTIRGLVINGANADAAIDLDNATGARIAGNFLGTTAGGTG
ncbi:MAG TPA: hypothetical protein VM597_01710, partial [Gemmataceae bacterium]|nr:hypothetical protein [Gemmataceae bacterium]